MIMRVEATLANVVAPVGLANGKVTGTASVGPAVVAVPNVSAHGCNHSLHALDKLPGQGIILVVTKIC
jgi:hypothetical protein